MLERRLRRAYNVSEKSVSRHWGYHFGGPLNKDCILGSILGSPVLGFTKKSGKGENQGFRA